MHACVCVYLFYFCLLKGELHGGHSQLVGKEIHVPRQLQRADIGSGAVSTSNTTQQLPLKVKRKRQEVKKTLGRVITLVQRERERVWLECRKRHRLTSCCQRSHKENLAFVSV